MSYNYNNMNEENRQDTRYVEIGRVVAPEICALNGILDDISLTGCKIHFPCILDVNLDNEYNLKISLSDLLIIVEHLLMKLIKVLLIKVFIINIY